MYRKHDLLSSRWHNQIMFHREIQNIQRHSFTVISKSIHTALPHCTSRSCCCSLWNKATPTSNMESTNAIARSRRCKPKSIYRRCKLQPQRTQQGHHRCHSNLVRATPPSPIYLPRFCLFAKCFEITPRIPTMGSIIGFFWVMGGLDGMAVYCTYRRYGYSWCWAYGYHLLTYTIQKL
ncbi:hypothetical protein EV424DRAFT_1425947 [Suillus variegatus]|nr:hypothetical protein EV424DRAFT_1425947 [Suillus variegatus]